MRQWRRTNASTYLDRPPPLPDDPELGDIWAELEELAENRALNDEINFGARADAIDRLDFAVIDRIDGLLRSSSSSAELIALKYRATAAKRGLEGVDERLFHRLRARIVTGACRGDALRRLIEEYVGSGSVGGRAPGAPGYDGLDHFVNGLLLTRPLPEPMRPLQREMVRFQQTPVRIIFDLLDRARPHGDDVFHDLGAGVGRVAILVRLLSGSVVRGIEFEPAYCEYARQRAAELALSGVEFVNVDARAGDFREGTIFFMYTPFEGAMLREVLARLEREARSRPIRIFTYGPCTPVVSGQCWLEPVGRIGDPVYDLGAFRSTPVWGCSESPDADAADVGRAEAAGADAGV